MNVTEDQLADLYALADHDAQKIELECARAGHSGKVNVTHRHEAVNVLVEAFNEEIEECGDLSPAGVALNWDDIRVRARAMCKERKKEGTYGFIETLLIMIALNLIAKVIVAKLLEWWSNRD